MIENTPINPNVTMPDPPKAARRFSNGDEILGRYVVQAEFGQGGMGVVYRCFDKIGGVEVAVKGLPPEVSHNADEMEAVRDNFQLVCALRHPGIAGIRTLEREESTGLYYLVMDVAEGKNLTRWMREHAEPGLTPEKLTILRDIASALDYAHERRILHRDIKPGNVMVGPDGHAQVLDFGLAAQIRSSMSRVSQMVTSQSGTPAYKSPEQWKGRPQRAAADQYSLAVVAYKMITGELPFDGDDLTMLGRAVMNEAPEKVTGVSASVNAALQKALAKEPEERFASCSAFVAALSSDGRARTPAAPLKWIAASVILLTLVAVGGWWWQEKTKSEELRLKKGALAAEPTRQAAGAKHKTEEGRRAAEKTEVERKAKIESERVVEEAEADRQANAEAEQKVKLEAERLAVEKAEAERKAKLEDERIAEEKRRAAEAAKPVPQKMLEALGAMGQDFAKCERDEYAALGIPLMTEILSCYRNYTTLFEKRKKLMESLTEKHPDIVAFGPRIERAKKILTETIARSAELVEKYASRYDCDLQNAVEVLREDVLAYEFFERKLPVSLKLKLRGSYSDYLSAVRKRWELLKTFTEAHPEVAAADALVRKAEDSFKSDVRAFAVANGWLKEEPARTIARQHVSRRDQESVDQAKKLYAVRDSGTHYVENAIRGYVDDGALPGAISVAYCDGEQEVACLGWADVEQRRQMSMDSMFMIFSQSKGVCGVAAAMLIEEGVLSLDDRVDKYLPEFRSMQVEEDRQGNSVLRPALTQMTLRHLLNNTAGFPFDLPERKEWGWMSLTISEVVEKSAKMPLRFDPGTANRYSNLGFEVAARIVEVVSGQTYEGFVKSRILDPLGMKDTTFNPTDEQLDRSIALYSVSSGAKAVRQRESSWAPLPHNGPTVKVSAAMGLWSTAMDQLRFYKMLMNLGLCEDGTRILKEETVRNLLAVSSRPVNLDGKDGSGYSLGFGVSANDGNGTWIGHGGAWGTLCNVNWHRRQLKLWVVQLVGGPRPWDKDRQGALERFFLSRKSH